MLNINKSIEYALIALRHINEHGGNKPYSAKEISSRYNIPQELLAKILQKLCKKNYLLATQGPHGGYSLNQNLEKINLIDFIESLEGPIGIVKCSTDLNCDILDMCTIKSPINKINNTIRDVLSKITLYEITT